MLLTSSGLGVNCNPAAPPRPPMSSFCVAPPLSEEVTHSSVHEVILMFSFCCCGVRGQSSEELLQESLQPLRRHDQQLPRQPQLGGRSRVASADGDRLGGRVQRDGRSYRRCGHTHLPQGHSQVSQGAYKRCQSDLLTSFPNHFSVTSMGNYLLLLFLQMFHPAQHHGEV